MDFDAFGTWCTFFYLYLIIIYCQKYEQLWFFFPELSSVQNMGKKENQELKFIIIEMENDFVSLELFVQFYSDAIVWKFVNDVAYDNHPPKLLLVFARVRNTLSETNRM